MNRQLIATLALPLLVLAQGPTAAQRTYRLGVLNWSNAPHNLEAVDGLHEALALSGVPQKIDLATVDASEAKARETLARWKQEKVDLIVAVGREAALLAVREEHDIPVVFVSIADPGLTAPPGGSQASRRNVTGSCARLETAETLRLFKEGLPTLRRLGVIYDKGNPVSAAEIAEARDCAASLDLTLVEAAVTRADEIAPQAKKLSEQNIDALWVPTDALVCQHLPQIAPVARDAKLPVVAGSPEALSSPADGGPIILFAVIPDYGHLGRLGAEMALDILTTGKSPAEIPVRTPADHAIIVNTGVASSMGRTLPPAFLAKAQKIVRAHEGLVITIAGTGDSEALMQALAAACQDAMEGGKIEVAASTGSTGGLRAVLAGKADLARVARELSDEEAKAGLICKTFAKAPIAFVVHPSVTGITNVTTPDIVGIYSGTVTKWDSLGAKEGRIYAVIREPGDSCLRVLHAGLPGLSAVQEPKAKVIYSTAEARDALVEHRNTFGFLAMPVVAGTDLRVLSVDGVYPSEENVRNGTYKLLIPLGIVYRQDLTGPARRFVDFLDSKEAQTVISSMGAVPVGPAENDK